MRRSILMFATALCISGLLHADVIHLSDGTSLEGDVHRSDDGWVVTTAGGKTTKVSPSDVSSIEMKPTAGAESRVAAQKLTSLQRAVQNSDNLADIIARYKRLIDQNKDSATDARAKVDLQTWQDRLDKHMLKAGGRWILPEQQAQLATEASGLATQAKSLLLAGKMKEAEPVLVQAIADDPKNAGAQYLLGVLRYSQEAIPAARNAFEAAVAAAPDDAPSHNNLAVTLARQHQVVPSLMNYDAAMLAARVNRVILDNVAAALATLPNDARQGAVVAKVRRHFNEQDSILQQQMARSGMRRFGATWIDERQFAEMEQQRKLVQDKIDSLSNQFDKQQELLHQIDQRALSIQSSMHQIEATSFTTDPKTGAIIQLPYPPVYLQMQRDLQLLQGDRQHEAAKLSPMQEQARALQKQLPSDAGAKDTQRLIGPDAMPVSAGLPASTRPAS